MHCPVDPASITAPAVDAESLVDRERLVGGGPVMYTCRNRGIPTPMVRWYHNGELIQPDSGVSVNGNQVVISEPQVSNSGAYQCMVSNTIDGVVMEDMRQWVLEVREPGKLGRRFNGLDYLPLDRPLKAKCSRVDCSTKAPHAMSLIVPF